MSDKEVLDNINKQISAFDTKASILIASVGVIFALISNLFFNQDLPIYKSENVALLITYKVLFVIFFINSIAILFAMIMVVFPRRRKKDDKLYANYYRDIVCIKTNELNDKIRKLDIASQIKINAKICLNKEKWLRFGIYLMSSFVFLIFSLVIIAML